MFFLNDRILGNIVCTKIQNNIRGLQINACTNLRGELSTPKKGGKFHIIIHQQRAHQRVQLIF